jgi:hypothetical protein
MYSAGSSTTLSSLLSVTKVMSHGFTSDAFSVIADKLMDLIF